MAGGRPNSKRKPRSELMELALCFRGALEGSEFASIRAAWKVYQPSAPAVGTTEQNLYDLFGAYAPVPYPVAQHLGEFLGLAPHRVARHWHLAEKQRGRDLMRQRRNAPRPANELQWYDLPIPEEWLQELLGSQVAAAERFPYDLLDVRKPALSEVFVEQDVMPRAAEGLNGRAQLARNKAPASTLAEALASNEHLFITGNAGAGKTTVGQHLVHQLAQWWLRENDVEVPWCPEVVVPMRISARDLHPGRSWYQRLSDAAVRAGGLLSPVHPERFGSKPHGARWLVNVDGLDEVASPLQRAEILRTLAQVMKQTTSCRLVITSRPLVQDELAPLASIPGVGFYALRGFEGDRLQQFAARWFAAQGHENPVERAEGFLTGVADAGLGEILHTPLLTTIAAIIYDRTHGEPLPRGRVALYEAFLRELRHARAGASETLKGFEQRWAERGLVEVARWILAHQDDLLVELAWSHIRSDLPRPLLVKAIRWVHSHIPAPLHWPDLAESELGYVMALTGVLTFDGNDLNFLHRSFAEFIAAQAEAATIPSDFPGLGGWSDAIANAAERNRILFTFALWARREGNNVAVIVRHLLGGDSQHRLMALRLVTAGVPLGETMEAAVIDRLTDLTDDDTRRPRITSVNELSAETLRELSLIRGNTRLTTRLRAIASTVGVGTTTRIGAAMACAQLESVQTGVDLINEIAAAGHAGVLLDCYEALEELIPDETALLIGILRRALEDPSISSWQKIRTAERLADLGYTEGLVELARHLVAGPQQNGDVLERAGQLWLELVPETGADDIIATIRGRDWNEPWAAKAFAKVLIEAGRCDEAIPFATIVFNRSVNDDDMDELVGVWVDQAGEAGADAVLAILGDNYPWNGDIRPGLARVLVQRGFIGQALDIARMALADDRRDARDRNGEAIEVVVDALGADSGPEVLQWIQTVDTTFDEHLRIMKRLAQRGAASEVTHRIARHVLHHPVSSTTAFREAAEILLQSVGDAAWSEILKAVDARPFGGMSLRVALLPFLSSHERREAVAEIVREVMADPGVTVDEIREVVRAVAATQSDRVASAVAIEATNQVVLGAEQLAELADHLIADGLTAPAVSLRCRILEDPKASVVSRWRALEKLIDAGEQVRAEVALGRAVGRTRNAQELVTLRKLLAWVQVDIAPTPHTQQCQPYDF
ncbi:NACHT domain-containing protein [Nocardia testacea]|uniref:NACHT domain-containing protein n=1 Tax=Nocardia testacea TaxID=248551 RepID=A0ABW7VZR1_9NOCA